MDVRTQVVGGFAAGVLVVHVLLDALASGTSLLGLDLLAGGLAGAAIACRLRGHRVPRAVVIATGVATAGLALAALASPTVAGGWD